MGSGVDDNGTSSDKPGADRDDGKRGVLRHRWSRRATAWFIGAAALIAATSAAGLVANGSTTPRPKAAADDTSSKNALNAILLKNPTIAQPVGELVAKGSLPQPSYLGDTGRVGVPANVAHPAAIAGTITRYVPGSVKGDFNLLQLAALALSQGCPASQAPIAAAIAAAESGGNPGAQGDIGLMDSTWDWSQGLWQIRGLRSERGTGGLRDSLANADPEKNASAMMAISSGCTNWTPWSTYTSGAYLSYLGMSKTAVLAAKQYQNRTGAYPPIGSGQAVGVPAASSSSSNNSAPPKKSSPSPSKSPSKSNKPKPTHKGSSAPGARGPKPPKPSTSGNAPKAPVPSPTKTKAPTLPLPTKTKLPLPLPTKTKLPLPTKTKLPLPTGLPTSGLPLP
jgi:hypothetical protein